MSRRPEMILGSIKTAVIIYFIATIIGFITAFIIKIMFAVMKYARVRNGMANAALAEGIKQVKQEQEV
jgi:hypothetical protein